jgi:hypothetical protein
MLDRVNLADPDCEPTDEQLGELMSRAFASVREQRERAMEKLRARIGSAREEVLLQLEPVSGAKSASR